MGEGWEEGGRGFSEGGTWETETSRKQKGAKKKERKKKTSRKQEGARIRCVSARGKTMLERVKSHLMVATAIPSAKFTAIPSS